MCSETPVVFVVDDDDAVCRALGLLIESAGWQSRLFARAQEFLVCPRVNAPSCLLLDIELPDLNGLELQKRVAVERTDMPIIFITGHGDVPKCVQAMKLGAFEFLIKPFNDEVLLKGIANALDRSRVALGTAAALETLRARYAAVSPREREVMALVVSGLLNKQVGGRLGISEITVKAHRGNVMRKMGARSLADLVTKAAALELTTPHLSVQSRDGPWYRSGNAKHAARLTGTADLGFA